MKSLESNIEKIFMNKIIKSDDATVELIDNYIDEYNTSKEPFIQKETIKLNFHIKNENGEIIAGINAEMYGWNILYIGVLFIAKDNRLQGLGSRLLNHVENEAKALGATLAHLDTFDFQAKDFYLKHGYEIFGELNDCPKNHKRYYLSKKL